MRGRHFSALQSSRFANKDSDGNRLVSAENKGNDFPPDNECDVRENAVTLRGCDDEITSDFENGTNAVVVKRSIFISDIPDESNIQEKDADIVC